MATGRPRRRSARIAAILSLSFPGLGQVYLSAWLKGAATIVAVLVLTELVFSEIPVETLLAGVPPPNPGRILAMGSLLVAVWLWSVWDAARGARGASVGGESSAGRQ